MCCIVIAVLNMCSIIFVKYTFEFTVCLVLDLYFNFTVLFIHIFKILLKYF